jgi:hypothetical protein
MVSPTSSAATIFISYSHQDKKWLDRLLVHLKPLEREGLIEAWPDTQIRTGQRWREQIRRAIEAAQIAVLLISADFLSSDFIARDELPPLLKFAGTKGLAVFPILVSPSAFERTESLSQFQAANSPTETLVEMDRGNQERVFDKVAHDIFRVLARPLIELQERLNQRFREIDDKYDEEILTEFKKIGIDSYDSLKASSIPSSAAMLIEMIHLARFGEKLGVLNEEKAKTEDRRLKIFIDKKIKDVDQRIGEDFDLDSEESRRQQEIGQMVMDYVRGEKGEK